MPDTPKKPTAEPKVVDPRLLEGEKLLLRIMEGSSSYQGHLKQVLAIFKDLQKPEVK